MRFLPEGSPRSFTVTVHPFNSPTPHACAYEQHPDSDPPAPRNNPNVLVYIAGMTGGPHTHEDMSELMSRMMQHKKLEYTFFEFRMRSSYTGFGASSLANDVEDVSALVKYLREGLRKKKVVLMGSSTGAYILS
jgi:predicted alpha/beta-fold hydrolase